MIYDQDEVIGCVSINDLAISYLTNTPAHCLFVQEDGFRQHCCWLKVRELKRMLFDGMHLICVDIYVDMNRPGEDVFSPQLFWQEKTVLYDESRKEGIIVEVIDNRKGIR